MQLAGAVENVLSKVQDANSKRIKPINVIIVFVAKKDCGWHLADANDRGLLAFHCTDV
jgi:hypothetical protein